MKWKASSHAEAASVLNNVAKSGIRVLVELDVHVQLHNASNDNKFENITECKGPTAGIPIAQSFPYGDMHGL